MNEFFILLRNAGCPMPKLHLNEVTNETILTWRNSRDLCVEVCFIQGYEGYSYIIDDGVHCEEEEVSTDIPTAKLIEVLLKEMKE